MQEPACLRRHTLRRIEQRAPQRGVGPLHTLGGYHTVPTLWKVWALHFRSPRRVPSPDFNESL
jgi:hypothetical protein